MNALRRHNVTRSGAPHGRPLLFAHGFGCDQQMWRFVAPAFAEDHPVVAFDHAGLGGADPAAYDPDRHDSLRGYAEDLLDICRDADLRDVVLVGHSVSAMIGVLAVNAEPERFSGLVLLCPSPRYLDDDGYTGGFSRSDIDELLESLESNYEGWASGLAQLVAGAPNPDVASELTGTFCRADPDMMRRFAAVTFLSDNREDLPHVPVPTLVLQSAVDAIAAPAVGRYVHSRLPDSELVILDAVGHCPNLSHPEQTIAAIRRWL